MRDIPLLIGIVVFWFIVSLAFTGMATDSSIQQINITGNTTTVVDIDSTDINFTAIPSNSGKTTPITYLNLLKRIFTFRLSTIIPMPTLISTIISFLNYMLVAVFGTLIWRQFSIGGGSG